MLATKRYRNADLRAASSLHEPVLGRHSIFMPMIDDGPVKTPALSLGDHRI